MSATTSTRTSSLRAWRRPILGRPRTPGRRGGEEQAATSVSCGYLVEPDRGLGQDRPPGSPPLLPSPGRSCFWSINCLVCQTGVTTPDRVHQRDRVLAQG